MDEFANFVEASITELESAPSKTSVSPEYTEERLDRLRRVIANIQQTIGTIIVRQEDLRKQARSVRNRVQEICNGLIELDGLD